MSNKFKPIPVAEFINIKDVKDEKKKLRLKSVEGAKAPSHLSKPVYWIGKQWAVTSFGIECLDGQYFFERSRLWETSFGHGWENHLSEKLWVDEEDLAKALFFARRKFYKEHPCNKKKGV